MQNIDLIKEICFRSDEQPELMASLLSYKPSLKLPRETPFKKDHFHVVYLDSVNGPRIIFQRGADRHLQTPKIDFKTRLLQLDELNFDEVCFLIATYGHEDKVQSNTRVTWDTIPEKLRNIVLPTKGYLIFEEQGIELYRSLCEDNNQAAFDWLDQIKTYKKEGWRQFLKMTSDTLSTDDFKNLFIYPDYAPSFRSKPVNETYDILNLISEDYQIVEEHETWVHLRQDGFYSEEDQNELVIPDELLKAKLRRDAIGNYRIAFWLKNEVIGIDREIELGLNYDYATLDCIEVLTGCFLKPNDNQFILDFTATMKLQDGSDFFGLFMKANLNFALPQELEKNKMVYKLYQ